jgi:Zn finger protein HypA/HybF involved in hydrogenase expression
MQKLVETPIVFTCPDCKETFEFDNVGEYQLVPCPICGIDYITIKKGPALLLECFDFSAQAPENAETSSQGRMK